MPTTTTRHGLEKPATSDSVFELRECISGNADKLDTAALADAGTFAARPVSTPGTPGKLGRIYRVTDRANRIDFDHGTGWITLGSTGYEIVTSLPATPGNGDAINLDLGDLYPARYVTADLEWKVEHPLSNAPLALVAEVVPQSTDPTNDSEGWTLITDDVWDDSGSPSLTVPHDMDAIVRIGATISRISAGGKAHSGLVVNAETAPTVGPVIALGGSDGATTTSDSATQTVDVYRTGLVDGDVLKQNSNSATAGQSWIANRTIELFPTRFRA